jgi:GH18 family chitinase
MADKATQAVSVGTIRPTAAPPVDSKNYPPTDGIVDYTTSSKFKKSSGDAKMDHGLGWFKANQDIVKDTKIILAVGGDTWSDQFNLAFKNPDNIDNFVSSAIKLVTDNELDGIGKWYRCKGHGREKLMLAFFNALLDIDWEHWFQNEVSDADNLVTLMKKLREGFNKLQDKQYTLTFAAPTLTDDSVTKFTKSFKEMKQHIDWINLMAYVSGVPIVNQPLAEY